MTAYVALVRGVAPSTPPRNNAGVLRALGGLGFAALRSVLSSGNYVFTAPPESPAALESRIEATFESELGVRMLTIVRSQAQLQRLIERDPLAEVPHGRGSYRLVTFFKHPTTIDVELPYQPDGLASSLVGVVDGALFTLTDNSVGPPGSQTVNQMAWLERRYGHDLTSRTPLTLQKILAAMGRLNGAPS